MNTKPRSQIVSALLVAVLGSGSAAIQPGRAETKAPESPPYTEEQRITAIDTMVEIAGRKGPADAADGLPSYLLPEDFEVLDGSEPRSVVDVAAFGPAQHAPDSEPWTFVIYFDRALSGPAEASWAAGELFEAAGRLTDLGAVEVIVADPEPKTLLDPTRDSELLASVLAEIALFPEGEDHRILALRDEFLGEVANPDSEIDPGELAAFAVAEEKRIIARQLDGLLTHMVSTAGGSRRGLFLVSSGFDLRPQNFYRVHRGRVKSPPSSYADPEAISEALAQSLAAYGWITFAFTPPKDQASSGGLRFGKWRLGAPRGATRETAVDPLHPGETVGPVIINLLDLTRRGERDLEKAEAYLEFGETLVASGDHEEAEQALRMALYHLADDPATLDLQVKALVGLGKVLELQGRSREARAAFEKARELDAESVSMAAAPPLGELLEPTKALERLAETTCGAVVRDRETLFEALAGLAYRVRVTFQVSGAADGSLHPVEVRCLRKGCRARAPAWIRSGTPREVAAARIRRWLSDDQFEGDFEVRARLLAEKGVIELEAAIPEGVDPGAQGILGVTSGRGDPESIDELRHELLTPRVRAEPPRWSLAVELPGEGRTPPGASVAVLVDHLESGRWGATLVE